MAKAYHHVTREERSQIRLLKAMRYSVSDIVKKLKRHRSTISREIKRNRGGRRSYNTKQADKKATVRRSAASRKAKKMTSSLKEKIMKGIKEQWSPVQLSGRLNPTFANLCVTYC